MWRRISSVFKNSKGDVIENFVGRSNELSVLKKLLKPRAEAGRFVILTGPKDSGKSALLREFKRRQEVGDYPGVSRTADVGNFIPSGKRKNEIQYIFRSGSTLTISWGPKAKIDLEDLPNFPYGMKKLTEALTEWSTKDYNRYNRASSPAGLPTVIVDESRALYNWDPPGEKDRLEELIEFLMEATQVRMMNVVMVASDKLLRKLKWYPSSADLMNIGDVPEEEARESFCRLTEPALVSDDVWKDVYDHVRGRIGLLKEASEFVEFWESWKKDALLGACRSELLCGLEPGLLPKKKYLTPMWSKDDWMVAMRTMLEHKDGMVSYQLLCEKLSAKKVASLLEYGLLHYRPYIALGNDIDLPPSSFPLVMPTSRLHLKAMEELLHNFKLLLHD